MRKKAIIVGLSAALFSALPICSAHGMSTLNKPLSELLIAGGDDRVLVNAQTGVNKYFTNPLPHPTMLTRSSCTASYPSPNGFAAAQASLAALRAAASESEFNHLFRRQMNDVRTSLTNFLQLPDNTCLITAPSGTTTELFFSSMALLRRARLGLQGPILNIITAAEETGSGSAAAAGGRHFSSRAPSGAVVQNGAAASSNLASAVRVEQINLRQPITGKPHDQQALESTIENLLREAVGQQGGLAILHIVHASKLGLTSPSFSFAKRMKDSFGEALLIVVDAAQCRGCDGFLTAYLDAGCCAFITGSKIFQGTPFSGCIMVPEAERADLTQPWIKDLPTGLGDYFTADDVDERLTALRERLPQRPNIGLLLSWQTSLANMTRYFALPESTRNACVLRWAANIQDRVKHAPYIALLSAVTESLSEPLASDLLANQNTIVGVCVCPADEAGNPDAPLNAEELRMVYQLMTRDIASTLPATASEQERSIASAPCLLGQPVKINGKLGALRIALGAVAICNLAASDEELHIDETIVRKLSLIGKYYRALLPRG